jgi:hypothetical protein
VHAARLPPPAMGECSLVQLANSTAAGAGRGCALFSSAGALLLCAFAYLFVLSLISAPVELAMQSAHIVKVIAPPPPLCFDAPRA